MPDKPTTIPQLDTNQTNRTVPAPSKVTDGFVLNDILPSANVNYLHGWAGDWLGWLDSTFGDGATAAEITIPGGISGGLDLAGLLDITGTLVVSGNADFGAGIDVTGLTDITGTLQVSGNADFGAGIDVTGLTDVTGNLQVSGTSDLDGAVGIGNAAPNAAYSLYVDRSGDSPTLVYTEFGSISVTTDAAGSAIVRGGVVNDSHAIGTKSDVRNFYGVLAKTGAGRLENYYGFHAFNDIDAGDCGVVYSFRSQGDVDAAAGTVDHYYGYRYFQPGGTGAIDEQFGLYIDNLTRGSINNYGLYIAGASGGSGNNYAIWVDADDCRFDGRLGVGTPPSTATQLWARRLQESAATEHVIRCQADINAVSAGQAIALYLLNDINHTTGDKALVFGEYHQCQKNGAGNVIDYRGHYSWLNQAASSGTFTDFFHYYCATTINSNVTNLYGYLYFSPSVGGSLTNQYGIYMNSVSGASGVNCGLYIGAASGGTTNYAIWVDSGTSRFDGLIDGTEGSFKADLQTATSQADLIKRHQQNSIVMRVRLDVTNGTATPSISGDHFNVASVVKNGNEYDITLDQAIDTNCSIAVNVRKATADVTRHFVQCDIVSSTLIRVFCTRIGQGSIVGAVTSGGGDAFCSASWTGVLFLEVIAVGRPNTLVT